MSLAHFQNKNFRPEVEAFRVHMVGVYTAMHPQWAPKYIERKAELDAVTFYWNLQNNRKPSAYMCEAVVDAFYASYKA